MIQKRINKNYNSIDLFKFICAFLVIGIHTEPFQSVPLLDMGFSMITRIAVPFFFISAAFLFFKKKPNGKDFKQYIKRILYLYLVWSLIYFLIYIPELSDKGVSKFLIDFTITGYIHLWFLQATIVSISLCYVLCKYVKNEKYIFIIAISLLSIGLVFSTYYPLFENISAISKIHSSRLFSIIGTRNGIFYAPIYIVIGRYFALKKTKKISVKGLILGISISFFLLAVECILCVFIIKSQDTILWFSVVPLMYFVFAIVLEINFKNRNIFKTFRISSTLLYTLHFIWIEVFKSVSNQLVLFLLVSMVTLICSLLIYKMSLLKGFKGLHILY